MTRIVLPGQPLVEGATAVRPWRDRDIDALVAACQDPEISRWTRVPSRYGYAEAKAYMQHRHDAVLAGMSASFAIVEAADDDRLLGSVALMRFAWKHARGEVGYWLAKDARGHGHATRAVRVISRWGFEALGLERIDLVAATGNAASQRVAERSGFTREAVLRSYIRGKDERYDVVAFGLLAS